MIEVDTISEVVSCDYSDVDNFLTEWAMIGPLWQKLLDLNPDIDFVEDVLMSCSSAVIDREEWNAQMPGRDSVRCSIKTKNAQLLREELTATIIKFFETNDIRIAEGIRQETDVDEIEDVASLLRFLNGRSEFFKRTRGPAGHKGATMALANRYDDAARKIHSEDFTLRESGIFLTSILNDGPFGSSFNQDLKAIVKRIKMIDGLGETGPT
jgi:hypothetical protein